MEKEQLLHLFKKRFGVTIELNNLGNETVLLYHDELDNALFPSHVLESLPNPVLIHTYIYKEESEWLIGIAYKAITNQPLYLICLKDGRRIYDKKIAVI
ncbi:MULTISPECIES: hypothetical protein [Bacillus]|uniref:hypothetical protein n=1 Tax=Bacillus TaxID=1386 RepID=UPI0011AB270F|nr:MULTISPECIES: hypothetical protein [Bacillus]MCM2990712.1 hypothetical protein [Bacillus safensis]QHQ74608.1 hypothetical protein GPS65_00240 [Bacillus pumilus]